jgi:hypothetical protein
MRLEITALLIFAVVLLHFRFKTFDPLPNRSVKINDPLVENKKIGVR